MDRTAEMKKAVLLKEFKGCYEALRDFCDENLELVEALKDRLTAAFEAREAVKAFLKENGEPSSKHGPFTVSKNVVKEDFDLERLPREVLTYPGVVALVNTKAVSELMKLPGYAELAGKVAEARVSIPSAPSITSPKIISGAELDKMLSQLLEV